MSEKRISRNGDRFNQNDFVIHTREGTKSCQDLSEPSQESFYNSSGIDQGCGSPIIHNTSSGTCKDSVKISSATTNCVSKEKNELSVSNNTKHQVKNRVNLVDRELEVLQWPNFFSVEPTSNYSNRCFPDRVGSSLQWGSNIRAMVRGREILTHKCAGTTSNKTGSIFLHQREKGESHTLSDRQQGSLVLPFENGGNKERKYDQIEQRDLALSSKSQYGYHSRIPAFSTEYSSRQRIKKKTRLFRVASSSQSFSSGFSTTRFYDNRSICFPPMPLI